jgi:hypothetical protein
MPIIAKPPYDADSHILEPSGWLHRFVDRALRDSIPPIRTEIMSILADSMSVLDQLGCHDPATVTLPEQNVTGDKDGYEALGSSFGRPCTSRPPNARTS